MSMTLASLRHHRTHIKNAVAHFNEIRKLVHTPQTEMVLLALENHNDLLDYELSQAREAMQFCSRLNNASEIKSLRVKNIVCRRLVRLARQLEGKRLP